MFEYNILYPLSPIWHKKTNSSFFSCFNVFVIYISLGSPQQVYSRAERVDFLKVEAITPKSLASKNLRHCFILTISTFWSCWINAQAIYSLINWIRRQFDGKRSNSIGQEALRAWCEPVLPVFDYTDAN